MPGRQASGPRAVGHDLWELFQVPLRSILCRAICRPGRLFEACLGQLPGPEPSIGAAEVVVVSGRFLFVLDEQDYQAYVDIVAFGHGLAGRNEVTHPLLTAKQQADRLAGLRA